MTWLWERRAILLPWALLLAVLIAASWLVHALNAGRADREARIRLAEAEVLRHRGLLVVAQTSVRDLEAQVEDLGAELKAALAAAQKEAPSARPVEVVHVSTGPVAAAGDPRPCEPVVGTGPTCLLAPGDDAEVRVEQVELRTSAGNGVIVGTAQAWRLTPGPATRLFGGAFQAALSDASELPPEPAPGWGVGPRVGIGRDGWTAGVAVSPPPLALWGWRLELAAGAGLGAGGVWDASAAVMVRP